ncbi:MAG: hypothetical protein JNM18_12105 [Planctomycetaceae bacterium]|nr:hypothetical protein [Planctomycetaceae bacterium]
MSHQSMKWGVCTSLVAALVIAGLSGSVGAQYGRYYGRPYGSYGYGGYGYGYGYGATTAAGSYAVGMGQALRGAGAYNVMTAEANKLNQEAKQAEIKTRQQATEAFFEMRRMNREYTAAEAAARKPVAPTGSTKERLAEQAQRRRLTVAQLDPVTGQIAWPEMLLNPALMATRTLIDEMFAMHAAGRPVNHSSMTAAITKLRQELDALNGTNVNQAYAQAVTFLRLLGDSIHSPTDTLAANP